MTACYQTRWGAIPEWRKGGQDFAGPAGNTKEKQDSLSALQTYTGRREHFKARFEDRNFVSKPTAQSETVAQINHGNRF